MSNQDPRFYDYLPVPLEDFSVHSILPVDLYVKEENGNLKKIGQTGERFILWDQQQHNSGEEVVYLTKKDYAFHVGFNIDTSQPRSEIAVKKYLLYMNQMQVEIECQVARLRQQKMEEVELQRAARRLMNAVVLIAENPAVMKLLKKIMDDEPLLLHSISVSLWSCLVAEKLKWQKEQNFFKMALCGLLHDVGVAVSPEPYSKKTWLELGKDERQLMQVHMQRGANILRSIPMIPYEVAEAAALHHEAISEDQEYWAGIISVVNRFCEVCDYRFDFSLHSAYEDLCLEKEYFSETYLDKMKELIGNFYQ